ncbi:uncharacterized protein H6S33_006611 [Morchella sextelata]|uniref:uncharacterized protein n=1 Tax=Morchella sextelata TaxID=1174677 RepID=UPI001D043383|nr:uncharacterized protein H6S33_006611 [Morchella sextelata]KAH0604234.1 hypothetical protein H6S33_006611 [Morchella sextelata]
MVTVVDPDALGAFFILTPPPTYDWNDPLNEPSFIGILTKITFPELCNLILKHIAPGRALNHAFSHIEEDDYSMIDLPAEDSDYEEGRHRINTKGLRDAIDDLDPKYLRKYPLSVGVTDPNFVQEIIWTPAGIVVKRAADALAASGEEVEEVEEVAGIVEDQLEVVVVVEVMGQQEAVETVVVVMVVGIISLLEALATATEMEEVRYNFMFWISFVLRFPELLPYSCYAVTTVPGVTGPTTGSATDHSASPTGSTSTPSPAPVRVPPKALAPETPTFKPRYSSRLFSSTRRSELVDYPSLITQGTKAKMTLCLLNLSKVYTGIYNGLKMELQNVGWVNKNTSGLAAFNASCLYLINLPSLNGSLAIWARGKSDAHGAGARALQSLIANVGTKNKLLRGQEDRQFKDAIGNSDDDDDGGESPPFNSALTHVEENDYSMIDIPAEDSDYEEGKHQRNAKELKTLVRYRDRQQDAIDNFDCKYVRKYPSGVEIVDSNFL